LDGVTVTKILFLAGGGCTYCTYTHLVAFQISVVVVFVAKVVLVVVVVVVYFIVSCWQTFVELQDGMQ